MIGGFGQFLQSIIFPANNNELLFSIATIFLLSSGMFLTWMAIKDE